MSEMASHLRRCDSLASLTPAQLARLEESCRLRKYPRASTVYFPHDESRSILLMATGRAKLSHLTAAGKHSTIFFLRPGDLFGELAVCDSGERDEYCETIAASTIIAIPAAELRLLMRENPDLSLELMTLIGQRRRYIERRLKSVLFSTTRQKLSRVLLDLAVDYGESAVGSESAATLPQRNSDVVSIRLTIPFSHQELANLIGATRETVTITLGHLRNEGLIYIKRRVIVLIDPERLEKALSADVGW